jgi:hypothetical protein
MKPETVHDKVRRGLENAMEKLFKESAARNESLVVSRNGQIIQVPAKQLLVELMQQKAENTTETEQSS